MDTGLLPEGGGNAHSRVMTGGCSRMQECSAAEKTAVVRRTVKLSIDGAPCGAVVDGWAGRVEYLI